MTGKMLAAAGGRANLMESAEKINAAVQIASALIQRGYPLHSNIVGYHFDLAGIYARLDCFSFEEDPSKSWMTAGLAARFTTLFCKTPFDDSRIVHVTNPVTPPGSANPT
jgi:hypothetical protein